MLRLAAALILPLALAACTLPPAAPPRDIYAVSSPYGTPPPRNPGVGGSLPPAMPGLPPPQLAAPSPR